MQMKLELVAIPVSDVDRAKAFYVDKLGFNPDHDHKVSEDLRFVQLTPEGSACSIVIGTGITGAAPGSVEGVQMVVEDIDAVHAELTSRGVEISEIQDMPWGSFIFFADPDGNRWALQQIVPQRPAIAIGIGEEDERAPWQSLGVAADRAAWDDVVGTSIEAHRIS